ncbi:hypothetical protein J6590_086936 [Homalodisca vitripennis]|nr:hypothetical protein J6590_086936 [Homalodisca vitripennis]
MSGGTVLVSVQFGIAVSTAMTEQDGLLSVVQRIIIRFSNNEGVKPIMCLRGHENERVDENSLKAKYVFDTQGQSLQLKIFVMFKFSAEVLETIFWMIGEFYLDCGLLLSVATVGESWRTSKQKKRHGHQKCHSRPRQRQASRLGFYKGNTSRNWLENLSESLGIKRFESNEEVEEHVHNWLKTLSQTFYDQGIL